MNKQEAAKKYADEKYPLLEPDEYESDFSFHMSETAHLEIEQHFIAGWEAREQQGNEIAFAEW